MGFALLYYIKPILQGDLNRFKFQSCREEYV